jgi:hypothetical protein
MAGEIVENATPAVPPPLSRTYRSRRPRERHPNASEPDPPMALAQRRRGRCVAERLVPLAG